MVINMTDLTVTQEKSSNYFTLDILNEHEAEVMEAIENIVGGKIQNNHQQEKSSTYFTIDILHKYEDAVMKAIENIVVERMKRNHPQGV